jgi:hypothetical protein
MEDSMDKAFAEFCNRMWWDKDVRYSVEQHMLDYDPEIHGTRVYARLQFKEQVLAALWKERLESNKA